MLKVGLAIAWLAVALLILGLGLKGISEYRWFIGRPFVAAGIAATGTFIAFSTAAIGALWAGLGSQDTVTFWGLQCVAGIMAFAVGAAFLSSLLTSSRSK